MISKLLRDIELLEMHTLHMISKHMKISLTSKVYYFMIPSVIFDKNRSQIKKVWILQNQNFHQKKWNDLFREEEKKLYETYEFQQHFHSRPLYLYSN